MSRPIKNFTAANGTKIKGEGQALVQMTQSELPDSPVLAGFHSADVTTNLQSTSRTCDAHTEVLFTAKGRVDVPENYFSRHFNPQDAIQYFHRAGNTYATRVKWAAAKPPEVEGFPGQCNV